jgi:hypothetical protein
MLITIAGSFHLHMASSPKAPQWCQRRRTRELAIGGQPPRKEQRMSGPKPWGFAASSKPRPDAVRIADIDRQPIPLFLSIRLKFPPVNVPGLLLKHSDSSPSLMACGLQLSGLKLWVLACHFSHLRDIFEILYAALRYTGLFLRNVCLRF